MAYQRVAWDRDEYLTRIRSACYVCELVGDNPDFFHHVIERNDDAIVYLCKYPAVFGHVLVAPLGHREHAMTDFSLEEYLSLQRVLHRAGAALTTVVSPERMYVMSLGSQQGNRHVHWHLVPCPPGTPYDEQQLALLAESRGFLEVPYDEQAELAAAVGAAMRGIA